MYDACERLAFSASIREGADASTAIMTAAGDAIGLSSQSVPVLSGALPRAVRITLEDHYLPEQLSEGDSIITNDPWIAGGHLSDIAVIKPVFADEELIALVGSLGHVDDIGGMAGGWSTEASQVFEEGLLIPPVKLDRNGEPNETVREFIRSNVRLPDQVLGDLQALSSANAVGASRVKTLINERSTELFNRTTQDVLDRSEQALRNEIGSIENGTYEETMPFSFAGTDLILDTTVIVDGDTIEIDFAGTSDAIDGGINCPFGNILSVTEYVIKSMIIPEPPNTEGFFRPLSITAPEGSLVNCSRPKATMARHLTYSRVEETLNKALGKAILYPGDE